MKPVMQTKNNCKSACIASILEINLNDIDIDSNPNETIKEPSIEIKNEKNKQFEKTLGEKLNSLGYDEIGIGYNYFKNLSDEFKKDKEKPVIIDTVKKLKEVTEKNRNELLRTIPTNCHCILHIIVDYDNNIGHAVVGYVDNKLNITIIHNPNGEGTNIDLDKHCNYIGFIVKM